eukprot:scaffold19615_cov101-Isochrysis_galbana.AAC.1
MWRPFWATPHLNQGEQPPPQLGRDVRPRAQVPAEAGQPHVPQRLLARRLHHVGPVQVQKDGAERQHLLAVGRPAAVHEREEGTGVGGLAAQRLDRGLNVRLALRLQPLVRPRRHALQTHVLDAAVQLLEAVRYGPLGVHGPHGGEQLGPRGQLEVVWQPRRRLERLDH